MEFRTSKFRTEVKNFEKLFPKQKNELHQIFSSKLWLLKVIYGYRINTISFPESSLLLSSGGAVNKDLWDRVIRLTCVVRPEVQ